MSIGVCTLISCLVLFSKTILKNSFEEQFSKKLFYNVL